MRDGSPVTSTAGRRQRRRIDTAAHRDADPARWQPVGHGARQKFAKALVIGLRTAKIDRFGDVELPVTAQREAALAKFQQMRRGEPLYVAIDRAFELARHAEDEEVGDPVVVERVGLPRLARRASRA